MNIDMIDVLGKLHDFISKPILFALLGIMCVVFGLASLVLTFHWNKYSIDKSLIIKAQAIYFIGGAFIIFIALISIILY